MTARNFFILLLLIALSPSYKMKAQSIYCDSIDHYQNFIDSLVANFTINPASALGGASAHYTCTGKKGGSFAEMYKDSTGTITYRLTWQSNCDSPYQDKAYYFINNKIVLATDGFLSEVKDRKRKYYKNDTVVFMKGATIEDVKTGDKDMLKAYSILNDFSR